MKFEPSSPRVFSPHLNEEFQLTLADGSRVSLTLESVDLHVDDEVQMCFSLLFRSSDPNLPHGIYTLWHPLLGECALTVAPVRVRRTLLRHEAVVDLLKPQLPLPG